jgi:hypothetical protein
VDKSLSSDWWKGAEVQMNFRDARTEKIAKMTDKAIVALLLKEELSEGARIAFLEMNSWLAQGEGRGLSIKQREWVESALLEYMPLNASDVPRGKEVETPAVLKNLPLKPPKRLT